MTALTLSSNSRRACVLDCGVLELKAILARHRSPVNGSMKSLTPIRPFLSLFEELDFIPSQFEKEKR